MSHIVTIETQIKDVTALRTACQRLGLPDLVWETTQLFSGEATGYCVRLPDWRYPVVCNIEQGKILFDNFRGRWGDQRELDRLLQRYAIEKTRMEAHREGHTITEQALENGSVKLTIQLGETHENH